MTQRPFYELTGRLAEFDALQARLAEGPRLLVVAATPRSGTSRLLGQFDSSAGTTLVLADARPCLDGLDLAMQIADAAVRQLAPGASAWWQSRDAPQDLEGLRLARALAEGGVDLDALRFGRGEAAERLSDAFRLTHRLLDGAPGSIVVDHFGELLSGLTEQGIRRLLGDLRIIAQRKDATALVLVEPPAGPVAVALEDPEHPLFHGGQRIDITRAEPSRFLTDLVVTRPSLPAGVTPPLVGAVAVLAEGVPDLVWQTIAMAPLDHKPTAAAAVGWQRLQDATAAQMATEWALLRRVHPHAQTVTGALACGLAPTAAVPNPRSASDALTRLRGMGLTWQPRPRVWKLTDPLLASWIRHHAPPWTRRKCVFEKAGGGGVTLHAGDAD